MIILAGVFIFAAVVIFLFFQAFSGQPPAGPGEAAKLLHARIEKEIASKSMAVVQKIGRHGGYLAGGAEGVYFSGEFKPYWQVCQNSHIPPLGDITKNIEEGIGLEINSMNVTGFEGKNVSLGRADKVAVTIRDEDVLVKAWVPAGIGGYSAEKFYEISVPVPLGRIYSFASGFVEDNSEKRHIERFTASLFYHMEEHTMPTMGVLTECGDSIYRGWNQLSASAESVMDYAFTHIIWWEAPPENREYLEYYIPDIGSRQYRDLEMQFMRTVPLRRSTFTSEPFPVSIRNNRRMHSLVPYCIKEYDVRYSMAQPVMARITSAGNYTFDFIIYTFIYQNSIAICENATEMQEVYDPCASAKCAAKIKVTDAAGAPVENADVYFGGCLIGSTDRQGAAHGSVACGIAELTAYRSGYGMNYSVQSWAGLLNMTLTIPKNPVLHFSFSTARVAARLSPAYNGMAPGDVGCEIPEGECLLDCRKRFENSSCEYEFNISGASDNMYTLLLQKGSSVWDDGEFMVPNTDSEGRPVPLKTAGYVPPGSYHAVNTLMVNVNNRLDIIGESASDLQITEVPQEQEINIIIPSFYNIPEGFDWAQYMNTTPNSVLSLCGLSPVSHEPPEIISCIVAHDPAAYAGCGRNDINDKFCPSEISTICNPSALRIKWLNTVLEGCRLSVVDVTKSPCSHQCGHPGWHYGDVVPNTVSCPEALVQSKIKEIEEKCRKRIIFRQ
jgi:hypothetical protein